MGTQIYVCVCVYMHVLEWHFLFWSGLPDTQQVKSNITAMKNIGNAWFFAHNDICFDNTNIFSIWAKTKTILMATKK